MHRQAFVLLVALGAAACNGSSDERSEHRSDAPAPAVSAPASPDTSANDTATTPPASTAPTAPAPAQPAAGPMPAPGTIGFAGFGPAKFGATQEAVRMAWGKDMQGAADQPGGCYYLQPVPQGGPVSFMMEGDRFVRIDVDAPSLTAPGGGQVGMGIAQIRKLYPGAEERPHKYDENGKYLRVKDPSGGKNMLVFEIDGAGNVVAWRVGMEPQVDYVEGCA